jgi:hypothetical protein
MASNDSAPSTYYQDLGVREKATAEEIVRKYSVLRQQYVNITTLTIRPLATKKYLKYEKPLLSKLQKRLRYYQTQKLVKHTIQNSTPRESRGSANPKRLGKISSLPKPLLPNNAVLFHLRLIL